MRIVLTVIAWLLMIGGLVWFLQGINVIPGSFMTGRIEWAVGGVVSFAVGLVLRQYVNRGLRAKKQE